jgi:hypothetical protein
MKLALRKKKQWEERFLTERQVGKCFVGDESDLITVFLKTTLAAVEMTL